MTSQNSIRIAAALMSRSDGRVLLVRKRATESFMQPGGKIEAGEHPRDESAQGALVQPSRRLVDHAASVVRGRSHMTSRTSIHSYSGSPPGPGSEET